ESGGSVKGVSSKLIRRAIQDQRLQIIENPFFLSEADRTLAFEATQGEHYSAICAPIRDDCGRMRAVVYLSNAGHDPDEAYGLLDGEILEAYTRALGQVFSVHLEKQRREQELAALKVRLVEGAPDLIGDSPQTLALRRILHEVHIPAATSRDPDPLLVLGESGTGKDLVARYIHAYGARAKKTLRVANCGEITDELASSRFSGHAKGAFTGALQSEPGFFRASNGGVLFLDEIGNLRPCAQAALLRALDNRAVTPVGETQEVTVDVYVILATNRDLDAAVREGSFREDLYRRFKTNQVRLTPLRERPWDVPPLAAYYVRCHERRTGKKTLGLTADAVRAMVGYSWPGNVREVKNVCSLLVMHAKLGARLDRAMLTQLYPEIGAAPGN